MNSMTTARARGGLLLVPVVLAHAAGCGAGEAKASIAVMVPKQEISRTLRGTIKGRDDPLAWWNDNVELFLDVAGRRRGFYRLIVNPDGAVFDGKGRDITWTCEGLKTAAHVGGDFWSLEVYVPLSAFPDATRPGTGVVWYGNFTGHRVADRKPREYQRLNTTYEPGSHNMMAFGPIRFVE